MHSLPIFTSGGIFPTRSTHLTRQRTLLLGVAAGRDRSSTSLSLFLWLHLSCANPVHSPDSVPCRSDPTRPPPMTIDRSLTRRRRSPSLYLWVSCIPATINIFLSWHRGSVRHAFLISAVPHRIIQRLSTLGSCNSVPTRSPAQKHPLLLRPRRGGPFNNYLHRCVPLDVNIVEHALPPSSPVSRCRYSRSRIPLLYSFRHFVTLEFNPQLSPPIFHIIQGCDPTHPTPHLGGTHMLVSGGPLGPIRWQKAIRQFYSRQVLRCTRG